MTQFDCVKNVPTLLLLLLLLLYIVTVNSIDSSVGENKLNM